MTTHPARACIAPSDPRQGFTLLEMVLVMFIVSLLVTAVFGIVDSVTQLTHGMEVEQQREARIHGFVELCDRSFRNLPPAAMVRLRNQQAGNRVVGQLILAGATSPISASVSGVVTLETEEAPDGYLRVIMRVMNATQAAASERGEPSSGLRLPLLDNVATMEWRFFDPRSGEWRSLWNEKIDFAAPTSPLGASSAPITFPGALRPVMAELKVAFGSESPQRWIFWVPPAQPIDPQQSLKR
jgi:prepilin-type N-terminal cleavage/methylation domain-containing protein